MRANFVRAARRLIDNSERSRFRTRARAVSSIDTCLIDRRVLCGETGEKEGERERERLASRGERVNSVRRRRGSKFTGGYFSSLACSRRLKASATDTTCTTCGIARARARARGNRNSSFRGGSRARSHADNVNRRKLSVPICGINRIRRMYDAVHAAYVPLPSPRRRPVYNAVQLKEKKQPASR